MPGERASSPRLQAPSASPPAACGEALDDGPVAAAMTAVAPDLLDAEPGHRQALVRGRLFGDRAPWRLGRFEVTGVLGAGATSVVYQGFDASLRRRIAIKVLRAALPAAAAERATREAQALAKLAHPNIVAVYESGVWEGRPFLAMELVEGQTLRAWLDAQRRTWQEVIELLLQVGRGLAAAHAAGLVHRDVKPANVMIGRDGRARVLDFGLVREDAVAPPTEEGEADAQSAAADNGSLTATGAVMGTPAYMAPEQRATGRTSARSDQFSFCVVLYEALFGTRPENALPLLPSVVRPARLRRVLARGLAPLEERRWPSMDALVRELVLVRWPSQRWRLPAMIAAMLAVLAATGLGARWLLARKEAARAAAEARAELERVLVVDAKLLAAAQHLLERDPTAAAIALREVRYPARVRGWRAAATATLFSPTSRAQLKGLKALCGRSRQSSDGAIVATPLANGELLRWRAEDGRVLGRVAGDLAEQPTISADGRWALLSMRAGPRLARADGSAARDLGGPNDLAAFVGESAEVLSVDPDGVLRRWRDGELVAVVRGAASARRPAVSFGASGVHLISAVGDELSLVRSDGRGAARRLTKAGEPRRLVGTSASERWVWVQLEGGDVRLFDTTRPRSAPRILRGHTGTVLTVDFSPDEQWMATASKDYTARLWPLTSAAEPIVLRGHSDAVATARFSSDGSLVVTASYDGTARVWRLDGSGDVLILRGHRHQLSDATFGPSGRAVVTCGIEPAARVWDVSSAPSQILGHHDAGVWSAVLDPSGTRVVTAGLDGTARIWSLDGARRPLVLRGHSGKEIYTALFSPDGVKVATGGDDGVARLWRAADGAPLASFPGHVGWVYGLAFSADGQRIFTGDKRGAVRSWAVAGPAAMRELVGQCPAQWGAWIEALLLDGSGQRLLSNGHGCRATPALVTLDGQAPPLELLVGQRLRTRLARSARGQLAIGEGQGALAVWAKDGHKLALLRGHDAAILHVAFDPSGRLLVSSSVDGSARVWEVDHPGDPVILRGHDDWVNASAFDAAGRRVVTASSDGTARVWDLAAPDEPIVLRGHQGAVRFADFTASGEVVTASLDGTVRLWRLDAIPHDIAGLQRRLHEVTSECLTADWRMQYLDEPAAIADAAFATCERAAGR